MNPGTPNTGLVCILWTLSRQRLGFVLVLQLCTMARVSVGGNLTQH